MLLFLTDDRHFGITQTRTLHACGIPTLCAKCETGVKLSQEKPVCGAIVDGRDNPHNAEALCRRLLQHAPELPLLLLLPSSYCTDIGNAQALTVDQASEISNDLIRFCRTHCHWSKLCSTYALSCCEETGETLFLGYSLKLPPQALTILSFLLFRAPQPIGKHELLAVCFPNEMQTEANLTVQISRINQIAKKTVGLPLIRYVRKEGYRICDGIL